MTEILLSRFFSWAIERGHTELNPVHQIPAGKRPKQTPKKNVPWLRDDATVLRFIHELAEPIKYMFYLGNRSGLRTGELSGLRMSDFDFLDEGVIRVRFSYDGPLKEDRNKEGKLKWVPAADDCVDFLGPWLTWLTTRKVEGAGPEALVFPGPKFPKRPCRKAYVLDMMRDQWIQSPKAARGTHHAAPDDGPCANLTRSRACSAAANHEVIQNRE